MNFFMKFDFKNWCKNEFMYNNEKLAADPEIEFLTKSIPKPYGRATAMSTAWELNVFSNRSSRD